MTAPFDATRLLTLLGAVSAVSADATVEQLIAATIPALRDLLGGDVDVQLDADGAPVLVGVDGTTDPAAIQVVAAILADQVRLRRVEIHSAALRAFVRDDAKHRPVILDAAPCAILVVDLAGSIVFANAAAARLGRAARRTDGPPTTTVDDFRIIALDGTPLSPDELNVNHSARSGTTRRDRISGLVAADGSVTWVLGNSTPLCDDHGVVVGAVNASTDITEQIELQLALTAQAARLRAAERVSGLGSWELDEVARTTTWSDGMYELCGLPLGSEVTLHTLTDLTHPDDRAGIDEAVRQATDERRRVTLKVRVTRPDGTEVLLSIIGEPVVENDRVIRLVGVIRDVTAEMAEEERLRRIQQLESIGQLAGGLAHDLNNLLTVLSGHAELLGMIVTDRGAASVGAIRDATERAAALTRQLSQVGRREILQPQALEVNTVLRRLQPTYRQLLPDEVTLEVRLSSPLPTVLIDPGRLEQVLLNVVLNAVDAIGGRGSLLIETSIAELAPGQVDPDLLPGTYTCISITDDGSGMPPEVLRRVFEPFFTTKGRDRGSGLGLPTSFGIMRQSGGHLSIYSEPGHGTTVRLYLPITDRVAAGERPHRPPRSLPAGLRVLLVEDNDAVLALATAALTDAGCIVLTAIDGPDGAAAAASTEGPIDLLVTDVSMPGFGGHELAERVAATRPGIRVLYVSGYTENSVVLRGIVQDDIAFLAKPFTVHQLLDKVADVVADHSPAGDLSE